MKKKSVTRFIVNLVVILAIVCICSIFVCNISINRYAKTLVFSNVSDIPYTKTGLLLGTSPFLKNGNPNLYFNYRVDAAAELYNAKKVKYILISGDNRRDDYNEPQEMKNALVKRGVPEHAIFLDYAGLRTLDSVVRAKEIFGQDSLTVISQKFHNERAVYLASENGINAIGFNAKDVSAYAGFKTQIRELLARVKVFVDLFTNKQPRHLGDKVSIPA